MEITGANGTQVTRLSNTGQQGAKPAVGITFDPKRYEALNAQVQGKGWLEILKGCDIPEGQGGSSFVVVDLGSGHGANTAALAKAHQDANVRVYGIDFSQEMVRHAQSRFPNDQYPNLRFLAGSAVEADRAFASSFNVSGGFAPAVNTIVSNYTLHWVARQLDETFRACNRLQPIAGEMHHFCGEQGTFAELFKSGYATIRENPRWSNLFLPQEGDHTEQGEWRHSRLISEPEMRAALDQAGYRAWELRICEDKRVFESVDELKAWVGSMIRPFMTRVPEDQKGEFVNDWIARYQRDNPELFGSDGTATLIDRNILVRAVKVRDLTMPWSVS